MVHAVHDRVTTGLEPFQAHDQVMDHLHRVAETAGQNAVRDRVRQLSDAAAEVSAMQDLARMFGFHSDVADVNGDAIHTAVEEEPEHDAVLSFAVEANLDRLVNGN